MLRIAICDDHVDFVQELHRNVVEFMNKHTEIADITDYSSSSFFQADVEDGRFFDLILTDIKMPHIDGMKLTEIIRRRLPDALVIFVTAYDRYAVDSFELSVFRYISKDALTQKLPPALEDALIVIHKQADQYYTISTPTRFEKIALRDILYIRRESKNCIFYLADNSSVKERGSLTKVEKKLSSNDFAFSEKGCIVNLLHIVSIRDTAIELDTGTILPASHTHLRRIKKNLYNLWETFL